MTASKVEPDPRLDQRANVFLVASLYGRDHRSTPVRIRNISPQGALVDGRNLPAEGINIALKRGRLAAFGEVAWRENSLCGLRFSTDITVQEWVRPGGHLAQSDVDHTISMIRAGLEPTGPADRLLNPQEKLDQLIQSLDEVAQALACTAKLDTATADELLKLGAIVQRLRRFRLAGP